MSCPYCGAKLTNLNQNFCRTCGGNVYISSERLENKKNTSLINSQITNKARTKIGPESKKCFVSSLISLPLAIHPAYFVFAQIFGDNLFVNQPALIVVLFLQIISLLSGIYSRIKSKKAGLNEAENSIEKVGSVFAMMGIAFSLPGLLANIALNLNLLKMFKTV